MPPKVFAIETLQTKSQRRFTPMELADQYKERFLLLRNNACCAILKIDEISVVYLVLSPCGAFVHIYSHGNVFKHLTRFVPNKFYEIVSKVLVFRNSFCTTPFLCNRYASSPHQETMYPVHKWQEVVTKNVGDIYPADSLKLYLCPFKQRLCEIRQYYVNVSDNCVEYPLDGLEVGLSGTCSITKLYSVNRIPSSIKHLLGSEVLKKEEAGGIWEEPKTTTLVHEATELLDALMTGMSVLALDKHRYPMPIVGGNHVGSMHRLLSESKAAAIAIQTMVVVEYLDGGIYLANTANTGGSSSASKSVHDSSLSEPAAYNSIHRVSTNPGELVVEAWLSSAHLEATFRRGVEEAGSVENETGGEEDAVLRLCGEYFTLLLHQQVGQGESTIVRKFHQSFVQYELERLSQLHSNDVLMSIGEEDVVVPTSVVNSDNSGTGNHLGDLVTRYVNEAVKLIRYRDYLLEETQADLDLLSVSLQPEEGGVLQYQASISASLTSPCVSSLKIEERREVDGTHFCALLKKCGEEEAAQYHLSPTDAANEYCRVDQYRSAVENIKNQREGYTGDRNCMRTCVTLVSATFADFTIMKLDVLSQVSYYDDICLHLLFSFLFDGCLGLTDVSCPSSQWKRSQFHTWCIFTRGRYFQKQVTVSSRRYFFLS
jgi:hypothetical protein